MRKLTIGLVVLIAAVVLMAGAAAAHGMAGAANDDGNATDETPMDDQQEECEAMMGEMDDCPMADGGMSGMMGMMHGDGMEECQEMMDDEMMNEMDDEMMEECQEMMDEEMMDGMMDGGMGNMMNGNGSGMGCH